MRAMNGGDWIRRQSAGTRAPPGRNGAGPAETVRIREREAETAAASRLRPRARRLLQPLPLVGVLLVRVALVGYWSVYRASTSRTPVLVAAHALSAGRVLHASDLQTGGLVGERTRARQLGRQARSAARERRRPRGANPGCKRSRAVSAERPAVVLALAPVAERAIEPLLFGAGAVVEPLASVGEADELDHELGPNTEAVLLSPDLSGLTPAHCVRARARGARLVGIALDENDRQALGALAGDDTVDEDAGAAALRRALRAVFARASAAPPSVTAPSPGPRAGSV